MTARTILLAPALALTVWGGLYGFQRSGQRRSQDYEHEMQSPAYEDPPDAWVEKEFAFARLRYRSYGYGGGGGGFGGGGFGRRGRGGRASWGTDSNTAERHFMQG